MKKITKNKNPKGIYINGIWNPIYWINNNPYRERVEILIIKDDKIFLRFKRNGTYKIPRECVDKNKTRMEQAYIEAKNQANIELKNIKDTKIKWIDEYNEFPPIWQNELEKNGLKYKGAITFVFIGEYNNKYYGYSNPKNMDFKLSKYGKFYKISEVYNLLIDEHKKAIDIYKSNNNYIKENFIFLENTSKRKYKCPYCNYKDTRINLVSHVEKEHMEMIPKGYTPARVIFNSINKKDHGTCVICGKETKWDESRWKYERICSKKCHDKYVKTVKERMKKKYGKEHLLNDTKQQEKMLANRRISGNYKFKDGGIRSYCGSYEKKLLEFFDKVLEIHSKDIISPGPIIEYIYKGKSHKWITDQYYVTANLVFDVKDGGDNPNTREMNEYRSKQIAKEYAIKKQGKYNYIRLTNNNFEQLLYILAELKEKMIDPNSNKDIKIVNINENASTNAIPSINNNNNVYITNNLINNTFVSRPNDTYGAYIIPCKQNEKIVDTLFSTDKFLSNLYKIKNKKIEKINIKELKEYTISLFKYKDNDINKIKNMVKNTNEIEDPDYFYKYLTNKNVLSKDQILFDSDFKEIIDGYTEFNERNDIIKNTLNFEYKNLIDENKFLSNPIIIKKYNNNINILEDLNGHYAKNIINNNRTRYYDNIKNIKDYTLKILNII